MTRSFLVAKLFVVTVLLLSTLSFGQPAPAETAESLFAVNRITTDLQALAVGVPNGSAFVMVNGDLYKTEADLPLSAIKQQLGSFPANDHALYFHIRRTHEGQFHHHKSADGVQAITTSANGKPKRKGKYIPEQPLKDFGKEVGFAKTIVQPVTHQANDESPNWAAIHKKLVDGGDDSIAETPTGDDTLQLYPVLTPLSRQLFHNSDCVLTVELGKITADDLENVAKQLTDALAKLKLDKQSRITVLTSFSHGKIDEKVHAKFFDSELYTKDLGFKEVVWADLPQQ